MIAKVFDPGQSLSGFPLFTPGDLRLIKPSEVCDYVVWFSCLIARSPEDRYYDYRFSRALSDLSLNAFTLN